MQGWYQFGYDGFPSGEARRQFYRQRDDPCDSEEEQEAYDGNDRPVYYYPMHRSEETSSAEEEEEIEELSTPLPPASPFPLHVSIWDSYPGRFGSVILPLNNNNNNDKDDIFFFIHGGVMSVNGQVSNSSDVLRMKPDVSRAALQEAISVVPLDPSLANFIRFTNDSPLAVYETEINSLSGFVHSPPKRFGHSAVVIPSSFADNMISQDNYTNCKLYLTLIIGGAFGEHIPKMLHNVHIRGSVICEPWICLTLIRNCEKNIKNNTMNWTVYYPLKGLTPFTSIPRVFATLTPWPIFEKDSERVSYAYLGGSTNGWDPLPLFGLWLLHLDKKTWRVSTTLIETFGEEPPSRFGHSAVMVNSQEIYVFGGIGVRRSYLNDLVVLNCETKVWREIFVPSIFSMPSRAFHSSFIIPNSSILIIIGGEAGGYNESSVWKYNIDHGNWSLLTFPLLHRTLNLFQIKYSDTFSKLFIDTARILCERERTNTEGRNLSGISHQRNNSKVSSHTKKKPKTNFGLTSSFSLVNNEENNVTSLGSFYFAAMHGSLLQTLEIKNGVMIFGGTKSPCVTSLTWFPVPENSLKEITALWICMHRSEPFSEVRRLLTQFSGGIVTPYDVEINKKNFIRGGDINLAERSLVEDQLDQWRRDIRKRLREQ